MRRFQLSRSRPIPLVSALVLALGAVSGAAVAQEEKKGPPFADGPDAPKIPPRPEMRSWTEVEGAFTFSFSFKPGIGTKNELIEVIMTGLEKPAVPDPKWGSTVPMVDARLIAEVSSPAGQPIGRFVLHPVPLAQGKYGMHFTPTEAGLFGLKVTGTLEDGREVAAALKMPVDVWPLPKELEGAGDAGGATRRRVIRGPVSK